MENKYKICGIATKGMTVKAFMLENFKYLSKNGFEPHVVCQDDDALKSSDLGEVQYIVDNMEWGKVSLGEVLRQIRFLYKLFRKEKYDIIQYSTFNSALYASIAGWLARVPVRINCQWGISYPIYAGFEYHFRKFATRLICLFSTNVQPDSFTNLRFSIDEHLYPAKKGNVIYNGSACGVDLVKYNIKKKAEWKDEILKRHNIPSDGFIYGFVGRIEPEKGVNEVFEAFLNIVDANKYLFVVGSYYGDERLNQELYKKAKENDHITFTGHVSDTEKYYSAFNYLLLPSYQEGFGLAVLEAAGIGTPSIVSNIKGPTDVITDGKNGFVCEVKSAKSLAETMEKGYSISKEEYFRMCDIACQIVKKQFDAVEFRKQFLQDRLSLVRKRE